MKEVEKAKKEAAKFKTKRDKEKEKEKEKDQDQGDHITDPDDSTINLPKRNSTPYSYKPPPPYTLHSAPSVSQLVYQPPSLERFKSVRNSSNAVTTLALSLEPSQSKNADMPTPPSSPPDDMPYEAYSPFNPSQPPPPSQTEKRDAPEHSHHNLRDDITTAQQQKSTRPGPSGKRVFSDPGPEQSRTAPREHLNPGNIPRERTRSPYGYTRVPTEAIPKVERKRPSFQPSTNSTSTPNSTQSNHRTFSTPAYGNNDMGNVPEEPEPTFASSHTSTTSPTAGQKKPSFTYFPPPPPPPPIYTDTPTQQAPMPLPPDGPFTPPDKPSFNPPRPPPPPPRHGTTYIVLTPYLSHEVGHLSLVPFDTLVDVTAYTPQDTDLPYPTAFDTAAKHYWQASLGHRRGPRGLFPVENVCTIDDERVLRQMSENWFAESGVGFVADAQGRCWVGPGWVWTEPLRRRSKWWNEEF
jgi:hypothetical protein